jgi:hypothetical protein
LANVPPGIPADDNGYAKWIKDNPKLAIQLLGLAGSLLDGGGGGGTPGGIGPYGPNQANFTSQQPQTMQRTYNPTPAGFRPGFDPEHRYFTGVGSLSPDGLSSPPTSGNRMTTMPVTGNRG